MIDKIKELRIKIDGLSQLVKELKPFEWYIAGEDNLIKRFKEFGNDIGLNGDSHSPIVRVTDGYFPVLEQRKGTYCLKTDRGNYKCETDYFLSVDGELKSIDRNSKQINKAYDSLILAKAWLGKILGELGEESPYANDGKRKDVGDIEPTADTNWLKDNIDELGTDWHQRNHIEKVDWLRKEIKDCGKDTNDIIREIDKLQEGGYELIYHNIHTHLTEAKMWLEFELERIKENK